MNSIPTFNRIALIAIYSAFALSMNGCKKDNAAPIPVRGTMMDIDGNIYNTIVIGNQTWMQENLKTLHYRNGSPIPDVTSNFEWNSSTTGAYCYYNNDETNFETYGVLYNWYSVMDTQGLAPAGWHVASKAEWEKLIEYLGGPDIAGGKLKEQGTSHWSPPNTGASNSSGFTALPAGVRQLDGGYYSLGTSADFWTSTGSIAARHFFINHDSQAIGSFGFDPRQGYSVRCVKD